ncbi:MAG: hypothetical protein K6G30_02045 [Acetatifactor sp.]|nr:hypothetical protein [Acetatifactor sp.]
MKWKQEVTLIKDKKTFIRMADRKKEVLAEDLLIADLMEKGITDDDRLIREVSAYEENDEIQAKFRLAQFVEDYGDFLEAAVPSKLYE